MSLEDRTVALKLSLFGLDGDAGIVADALIHTGQGVEQRGLAGVGIADQRDGGSVESHGQNFRFKI